MQFHETHFDHYLNAHAENSLHPALALTYKKFPAKIANLKNLIFYGPKGVGKYTQMLAAIKKYSPSELKYEKKLSITYNKNIYFFKISDIHYEIDMSLIGCHSKMLWNEVYNQIVDILLAKSEKSGIIVCKYFHEIHSELLDIFYSYMQSLNTTNIDLKFVIITEEISFIPNNIVNCCHLIKVPRPSRTIYNRCLKMKLKKNVQLHEITNIKNIHLTLDQLMNSNEIICNKLVEFICNVNTEINFYHMREHLYDIFIYNLDSYECIWFIVNKLISMNKIKAADMTDILIKMYTFLKYYNNNYRPIYHFESFIVYLAMKVHAIDGGVALTNHSLLPTTVPPLC
jgi:hypothetical protein